MRHSLIPLDVGLAQVGLLLTVVGLWLGGLNWTPFGRQFDRRIFCAVNRLPSWPVLDWLMWSVTHLGSAWSGMAALAIAILWGRPRFGIITALSLFSMGIIIGVAKSLIQRPRPFTQMSEVRVIGLRPADLSYPSGHTMMAFGLATLLALGLSLSPQVSLGLYGLAGVVGYSRVHLGVHYPLDVLSGAVTGTGWGMVWVSYLYR